MQPDPKHPKTRTKTRHLLLPGFWDVIVGLPAGVLIFMTTLLFSTLLSIRKPMPVYMPLLILGATATCTGLLAGVTRMRRGPATGLAAGLVAASILGWLWLSAGSGEAYNPLVFGPFGMIFTLCFSPLGGWLGARFRKAL